MLVPDRESDLADVFVGRGEASDRRRHKNCPTPLPKVQAGVRTEQPRYVRSIEAEGLAKLVQSQTTVRRPHLGFDVTDQSSRVRSSLADQLNGIPSHLMTVIRRVECVM